jgi:hypothetical protein
MSPNSGEFAEMLGVQIAKKTPLSHKSQVSLTPLSRNSAV